MGTPGGVGYWVIGGGCALLLLFFIVEATRAKSSSQRFANLALGLGISCAIGVALLKVLQPLAVGLMGVIIGAIGACAGIAALIVRRTDRGIGVAVPVLGLVLSAAGAANGATGLLVSLGLIAGQATSQRPPMPLALPLEEPGASAWTYRSPYGFLVSLPSSKWKRDPESSKTAYFTHSSHMLRLRVESAPQKSEPDFRAGSEGFLAALDKNAKLRATAKPRQGTNAKGCRYVSFTATDSAGSRSLVAASLTWCADKQFTVDESGALISLVFEGASVDVQQLEKTAEFIFASVEDDPQ